MLTDDNLRHQKAFNSEKATVVTDVTLAYPDLTKPVNSLTTICVPAGTKNSHKQHHHGAARYRCDENKTCSRGRTGAPLI